MPGIVITDQRWIGSIAALLALAVPGTASFANPPTSWTRAPDSNLPSSSTLAAPKSLLSPDAVIDEVIIQPGNIFDLNNPKENSYFYRLTDKLHVKTRSHVVGAQLLFSPGDSYDPRFLQESERILRSNRFIQDASIQSVVNADGNVDVKVRTSDTWSLVPSFSFSRSGGKNDTKLGIREMNLLGSGIEVEAISASNVDRDSKFIKMFDPNVGNSWYQMLLRFENNSDGDSKEVDVGKPFYSLDSTDANKLSFYDNQRIDSYYDLGDIVGDYAHASNIYDVSRGWSKGLQNGWATRYVVGAKYDEQTFTAVANSDYPGSVIPDDRKLVYPYVGIEWIQDDFEKAHNFDQIGRVEDRFVGTRVSARAGPALTAFGSDRGALMISIDAEKGLGDSQHTSWLLSGSFASRYENRGFQNLMLGASARFYQRQSDKWLFFASLNGTYGHNLDLENPALLGGDNGLRGYPLRYQAGSSSSLVTFEERFFSNWFPLRLFHVGAALFFDAGRTWGDAGYGATNLGWLKDAGVGLRIGSTRSGLGNVLHVDLAFPMDGDPSIDKMQIVVMTKQSF
jgi:hypothetical protein